jgi:hypothetical protein
MLEVVKFWAWVLLIFLGLPILIAQSGWFDGPEQTYPVPVSDPCYWAGRDQPDYVGHPRCNPDRPGWQ